MSDLKRAQYQRYSWIRGKEVPDFEIGDSESPPWWLKKLTEVESNFLINLLTLGYYGALQSPVIDTRKHEPKTAEDMLDEETGAPRPRFRLRSRSRSLLP